MQNIAALLFFILASFAAGAIGSIYTARSIPVWYAGIEKPWFNPPSWVFGPVWTILYILMGASAYLVYMKGISRPDVRLALLVFAIQLILNALWSYLFFGLQNPYYALIEIIVLWIAILATAWLFYPIDKNAAYLLIPYLLWVSFAAFLNYNIWVLNP